MWVTMLPSQGRLTRWISSSLHWRETHKRLPENNIYDNKKTQQHHKIKGHFVCSSLVYSRQTHQSIPTSSAAGLAGVMLAWATVGCEQLSSLGLVTSKNTRNHQPCTRCRNPSSANACTAQLLTWCNLVSFHNVIKTTLFSIVAA